MRTIMNIAPNNREEIFTAAYNGSFYTITGCGGDLDPLAGLYMGRLAIFKILMSDRWFDDIVDNNCRRQETINEQG